MPISRFQIRFQGLCLHVPVCSSTAASGAGTRDADTPVHPNPASRSGRTNFAGNIARDKRNEEALHDFGWKVLVIRECETRNDETVRRRPAGDVGRPDYVQGSSREPVRSVSCQDVARCKFLSSSMERSLSARNQQSVKARRCP